MRTIHKFPLKPEETVTLQVCGGHIVHEQAKIVLVGEQRTRPHIWLEVNDQTTKHPRAFHVAGTGQPIPKGGTHVGSFMSTGGIFIWHVYEVEPE